MQRPIVQPIVQPIVKSVVNGGLFGEPGEALYIDFVNRHAEANGAFADFNALTSLTRASTKYAQDSNGVYQEFGANQPAITDKGLLIEPEATNVFLYNEDPEDAEWAKGANITVTKNVIASPTGSLKGGRISANGTSGYTFFRQRGSKSNADTGVVSAYVKKGNYRYVGIRSYQDDGSDHATFDFDTESFANTPSAEVSSVGFTKLGNTGWYHIWVQYNLVIASSPEFRFFGLCISDATGSETPALSGTEYVYVWGMQSEGGSVATSPIITTGSSATRAADSMDIELPSGTHDLVFTFDDGSTQTVSSQSGTYSIPTDLDRPFIRSLQTA